jgi:membrane protein implicated in regulation of membrane protease activity
MNAWLWAIGALIIAISELPCPGCYLIWIAAGAAVTALLSFAYDLSLHNQIQVFIVSTIVACAGGYFIYRSIFGAVRKEGSLNERAKQMIGKKGVVLEPIINGYGKVRLGDTVWLAEGPDLKDGTPIIVNAVRGITVIVSSL